MQEQLEGHYTPPLGTFEIDIFIGNRGKHFAAALGTTDQHIEAPLTTFCTQWAEAHGHVAKLVATVANRDKNHITFVALHVFQVLDEKRLAGMLLKKGLHVLMLAA
ncbi:hypothetical protein D3C81_1498730 [compost metagenome]